VIVRTLAEMNLDPDGMRSAETMYVSVCLSSVLCIYLRHSLSVCIIYLFLQIGFVHVKEFHL
jgi:hypothetical protein